MHRWIIYSYVTMTQFSAQYAMLYIIYELYVARLYLFWCVFFTRNMSLVGVCLCSPMRTPYTCILHSDLIPGSIYDTILAMNRVYAMCVAYSLVGSWSHSIIPGLYSIHITPYCWLFSHILIYHTHWSTTLLVERRLGRW